jgi:hypothetical protein
MDFSTFGFPPIVARNIARLRRSRPAGRERHSGAAAFVFGGQELADHLFPKPIAIDVGGVQEIDVEIERPRQGSH